MSTTYQTAPNHADSSRDLLYKLLLAVRNGLGVATAETVPGVTGRRLVVRRTTPTIADGVEYAVGDSVGGVIPVKVGTGAELGALALADRDDKYSDFDILFFGSSVPAYDNTVFVWLSANRSFLGRVRVAAGDFTSVDGVASATLSGLGLSLVPIQGEYVYAVLVTRQKFTYSTASPLDVTFHLQ